MSDYRTLRAWQVAHQLAMEVSRATRRFPPHERFALTAQLRRAALSVPTNLVEGRARFGSRDYLRFARIASASCAEVDYLLYFARESGYLDSSEHARLDDLRRHTRWLIARLARRLEESQHQRPRSPVFARVRPPS
jgi:four helix bundle protein